jgi:chromosome segregation ATPase
VRRLPPPTTRIALILAVLLLGATGCSEPPRKEIDQAQAAVDLALASGADKYAAEEYTAAAAGLQKARAAVDLRDYRQALSDAIDARQRAQDAIKQAVAGKARARQAAEASMREVTARVRQLQSHFETAEAAHVPPKELRPSRAALADVQKSLQEARTEIGAGNYDKAAAVLSEVRKKLDAAGREVENIPQRPQRTGKGKLR